MPSAKPHVPPAKPKRKPRVSAAEKDRADLLKVYTHLHTTWRETYREVIRLKANR